MNNLEKVCRICELGDFEQEPKIVTGGLLHKMYYVLKYSMPFVRKTKELVISADLNVENGQIVLANTTFLNNSMSLDVDKLSKLINYINPLDFSAKILENKDAKFNIENVKISDGKIVVDGCMTILKDNEQ